MTTVDEFFAALEEIELCQNAGVIVNEKTVRQVKTWEKAENLCCQLKWTNFRAERSNEFWDLGHFDEKYGSVQVFKKIHAEEYPPMRDRVYAMVQEKCGRVACPDSIKNELERSLKGLLAGAVREIAYHDVTDATFYLLPASWIFKGHFPCGYEGQFPNGKLIVY